MKTLNLEEAAQFLKMNPEGLRRLVATRKVPGAKPGKCWCFLEEDLVNYVRSLYDNPCKVSQGVSNNRREKIQHSVNETYLVVQVFSPGKKNTTIYWGNQQSSGAGITRSIKGRFVASKQVKRKARPIMGRCCN